MAVNGMWPGDRRVRIVVQRVRLGGREYRVISPARPLKNASLRQMDRYFSFTVDRPEGRLMGALWLLAARSRRSVVYLPTRTAPCPPGLEDDGVAVDLVMSHHSLQLRPAQWKRIRQRISRGNPPRDLRTARLPASDVLVEEDIDFDALDHAENRDLLRQHVYGETLFMTGSTSAFRRQARHFFDAAKTGPKVAARGYPYFPGGCNYHYCTVFDDDLPEADQQLVHVEYLPSWTR
ncbi:hypothetical protein [Spirillospora sp. NBC_01491]|uniref:hypothetical protein n=1 Tax=Spirillospora sp. NBC_01491 TaxID=2976007 RepID=UPI002E36211B|nr:hypothetical protein [Spirillospora sp. NBC_01491]